MKCHAIYRQVCCWHSPVANFLTFRLLRSWDVGWLTLRVSFIAEVAPCSFHNDSILQDHYRGSISLNYQRSNWYKGSQPSLRHEIGQLRKKTPQINWWKGTLLSRLVISMPVTRGQWTVKRRITKRVIREALLQSRGPSGPPHVVSHKEECNRRRNRMSNGHHGTEWLALICGRACAKVLSAIKRTHADECFSQTLKSDYHFLALWSKLKNFHISLLAELIQGIITKKH